MLMQHVFSGVYGDVMSSLTRRCMKLQITYDAKCEKILKKLLNCIMYCKNFYDHISAIEILILH